MEFENVRLTVDGEVGIITISNPPANALNQGTITNLNQMLDEVENRSDLKVFILTGEGKFFVAGADIKEIAAVKDVDGGKELALYGQKVFRRIETFSKPFIAVINGACLGGGLELAMACHIRYAAHEAKLGLPELNLGLIPGFAGTQRLPRLINKGRAFEMILASQVLSGTEAEQWGLVNRSFPLAELMEKALQLAKEISSKGSIAIASAIQAIHAADTSTIEDGGEIEAEIFGEIFETYDKQEGIAAFLEKRKPNFQNR